MKYQLHDSEIDSVTLQDDKIIFSFPYGFYVTDDNGQELEPPRRKLVFTIDRGCCIDEPLESFIYIRRRARFWWKDFSFKQFSALFKKGNMIVHDEYDSKSTNWKMIQINTAARRSNIELFIADIIDVECLE